ncbi:hypothetical protein RugamoR64_37770 [Duganella rhizosphaerae]|uniref:hypothetical protein n=1 Tax=Duganella rhizosphaerae TaxID=2885763 RepID=UPI0030E9B38F
MSVVKSSLLALAVPAIAPAFAAMTVNIDPAQPGAVINKNAYGQFAEHMGTGSPREMSGWIEYMTSDSNSTLAELRRKNGRTLGISPPCADSAGGGRA